MLPRKVFLLAIIAWTHVSMGISSVDVKQKELQSHVLVCSVFLYAGLGSLPVEVVSKELKAYKSHVRVIMYILSASAFADPRTHTHKLCVRVFVCVWSLGRATVESVYSHNFAVRFCEPERRNEHPEFIGH